MPLDYHVNDAVARRIPQSAYRSRESFIEACKKAWGKVPMGRVRAAIDSWPTRLRKCIAARGDYFEK